ncbi:hypothetical protein O181_009125 [Austropuccinia psidii MF-1]|uniref:Integrase catalytic domain-containing protein n=1 Tax=Austropuccinia psidii MF-1 TaxID=1389203 RepID=A0A9Q3BRA3_9BASI|nr:hypothetical protein [Austropuccinia psidii MF-1]
MWKNNFTEYWKTCDRCQRANKSIGKRLGNMIKVQEPSRPWDTFHMDWVIGLPPGGDRSYNYCLVIFDRFSKIPIFLPGHKYDKFMDTAIMIWNRVASLTGIFKTSLVTEIPNLPHHFYKTFTNYLGLKMVRQFCAYGLEVKDCDGLTHDLCTLLPSLGIAYRTSINASTNQNPVILEKGWNPRLPQDPLRKDLVEINPTAASFKEILEKSRNNSLWCMEDSFSYSKDKWDKLNATSDFRVGDLLLVSTTNFSHI